MVVAALEVRRRDVEDNSADRVTQASTWQVLEMLITGIAFGLIGLELRRVAEAESAGLVPSVLVGLAIAAVIVVVRFGWLALGSIVERRHGDEDAAPRSLRDATLMTWGGMRGLATIALALSIPATTTTGEPFPGRSEILVAAAVILLVTLVLAGLTFPGVVRALDIDDEAEREEKEVAEIAQRAYRAALAELKEEDLPEEVVEPIRRRLRVLHAQLVGLTDDQASSELATSLREHRAEMTRLQRKALQTARSEVLRARRERGTDPEAADKVLRRFDLQSVLLR